MHATGVMNGRPAGYGQTSFSSPSYPARSRATVAVIVVERRRLKHDQRMSSWCRQESAEKAVRQAQRQEDQGMFSYAPQKVMAYKTISILSDENGENHVNHVSHANRDPHTTRQIPADEEAMSAALNQSDTGLSE